MHTVPPCNHNLFATTLAHCLHHITRHVQVSCHQRLLSGKVCDVWCPWFCLTNIRRSIALRPDRNRIIVKPTINFTLARLGMQIANVKQRQILPRMGKIWVSTPQNLASERVYSRNCCSLKCKHIFGFYYRRLFECNKVSIYTMRYNPCSVTAVEQFTDPCPSFIAIIERVVIDVHSDELVSERSLHVPRVGHRVF